MFDHLLDRYGAYAVGLNSYDYGEPLLNRSRPKLIRQAKRCPLHTVLSTSLSVERCDAEDVRRKLRSRTLLLVWNVLGFDHNIHEYRAPRRMARRFGVALFHLTRPVDVSWDDPAVWRADVQTRLWGVPLAAFAEVQRLPGTRCRGRTRVSLLPLSILGRADQNAEDSYNTALCRAARSFFAKGSELSGNAPHCTRCKWNQDTGGHRK